MENTSACAPAGNPAGRAMKVSSSSSLLESRGTSVQYAPHPKPFRSSPHLSLPSSTALGILRGLMPASLSAFGFSFCLIRAS
eukprot:4199282-Pyramimonas_sp.AAC.1